MPALKQFFARHSLGLALLAALALRLGAIVFYNHAPESDELSYQAMAANFLDGRGVVDQYGNRAMFNAGYPLLVLAPVFAIFGDSLLAARLCNAALGVLTVALVWAVGRKAGWSRRDASVGAWMAALYLPASVYGVYLLKENLMIPLMLGVAWCALAIHRTVRIGPVALGAALLGILALVGNAALVLFAMVGFALLLSSRSPARKAGDLALIVALSVAVATPWVLRNMRVLGAPVLNTNGGFNFYIGNNPAATGLFVSIADTPVGDRWEALRSEGEVLASDTLKAEAMQWIRSDPGRFVALTVKKALYFWMPPVHEGKSPGSAVEKIVRAVWLLQYLAILGFAVFAFAKGWRNRQIQILWLGIVCYFAAHAVFYVIFRYREPIMPFVILLASAGVGRFFDRRAKVSGPQLGG